jgi:hypothetical protein
MKPEIDVFGDEGRTSAVEQGGQRRIGRMGETDRTLHAPGLCSGGDQQLDRAEIPVDELGCVYDDLVVIAGKGVAKRLPERGDGLQRHMIAKGYGNGHASRPGELL